MGPIDRIAKLAEVGERIATLLIDSGLVAKKVTKRRKPRRKARKPKPEAKAKAKAAKGGKKYPTDTPPAGD